MKRRVVITGLGVINPLGNDVETMWTSLKEGQVGRRLYVDLRRRKVPDSDQCRN